MVSDPLAVPLAVLFALGEGVVVQHLTVERGKVRVHASLASPHAHCPSCKTRSTRVHGSYVRTLDDLACAGRPVCLRLRVRRFRCEAASCPRRTFTEPAAPFAPPHARRTRRMTALLEHVGVALGAEAGARVLPLLGAAVSADTVLRAVHRTPPTLTPTPRVLGVDEWALRRGHSYGTILVDHERHAIVDLLPDRSAESFAAWLVAHPGVEVVTRDRSEIYAEGARRGAPDAIQVADRWHLLKNALEVVERVLHRHRRTLEQTAEAVVMPVDAASGPESAPTTQPPQPAPPPAPPPVPSSKPRLPREAWYEQIHALHRQGLSIHAITAKVGLSRVTVRKYLRAPTCPTRAPRRTKVGTFTAFDAHLRARWEEGCHDAVVLWRELRARGFRGSCRTIQRHVARWRPAGAGASTPRAKPPSPRQARWWLVLPASRLSPDQERFVRELTSASEPIRAAQALAVEFGQLVRAHDPVALESWMEQASQSALVEFRDFAAGLRQDFTAVRAAVEQSWSNGPTEGHVNKLKMFKRQMYGRASVGLLRKRLLHAA